jgi:predicted PurR-regulated permease PerM
MTFSIAEFIRVNRVIFIWTAFAFLIYIFRDLFGMIFMTFVMCFVIHSLSRFLYRFTGQKRRFLVLILYLIFFLCVLCFIVFGFPRIFGEARSFTEQLPKTLDIIDNYLNGVTDANPSMKAGLDKVREALTLESLISRGWAHGRSILEQAWHYVTWFFMALLFSFLIMLDLPDLIRKFRNLRYTKIGSIYDETASSVIRFAQVVGENFRAQIFISLINTFLTFLGLCIIGTGTTALLSVVVFSCGLIPVLGVFISSVPILLVALNVGGFKMSAACLLLIVIIHALEAYVLNPRIVSAVMKINPVITLMILYIAHSVMGIWGMLLGVPISVYFYRQISSANGHGGNHKKIEPGLGDGSGI